MVLQHLREGYIEYRPEKQSKKDSYRISQPFIKDNKRGINESAFRKANSIEV